MKKHFQRGALLLVLVACAFAAAADIPKLQMESVALQEEGKLQATLYTTVEGNLAPQDFQVEMDGTEATVLAVRSYTRTAECPTSYLLVLDTPTAMTQRGFTNMQEALAAFVQQLGTQDSVGILRTGDKPSVRTLRTDKAAVAGEIRGLSKRNTASTLNATILDALSFLETSTTVQGRKVLLVASTGGKRDETGATQAEVEAHALEKAVTIYTLAMMGDSKDGSKNQQTNRFGTIARQSVGGLDVVAYDNQTKPEEITSQLAENEKRFFSLLIEPPAARNAANMTVSIQDQDRVLADSIVLPAGLWEEAAGPGETDNAGGLPQEGSTAGEKAATPDDIAEGEPEGNRTSGLSTEVILLIGAGAVLAVLLVVLAVLMKKKRNASKVEDVPPEEAYEEADAKTEVLSVPVEDGKIHLTLTPVGKPDAPAATLRMAGHLVIGRSSSLSQFVIRDDPKVSGKHALLSHTGGVMRIEDLKSTNGTRVNDVKITSPTVVSQNDIITVGRTSLRVQWQEE